MILTSNFNVCFSPFVRGDEKGGSMRWVIMLIVVASTMFAGLTVANAKKHSPAKMAVEAQQIIDEYVAKFEPLDIGLRYAWYKYATTGDKTAFKKQNDFENEIKELDGDTERFAKLKRLYAKRKVIKNDDLRRQVEILYLKHLPNQIPVELLKQLTELETSIQKKFNDYRPVLNGKKMPQGEVDRVLASSTDDKKLEEAWKAQKILGVQLEKEYREVILLRNRIAKLLGYPTYLELTAEIREYDLKGLDRFYRQVRKATDKPFKRLKKNYIDPRLAKLHAVEVKDLEPWHYQNPFFQIVPSSVFGDVDLNSLYDKSNSYDAIRLAEKFFASMGVDVTGTIKRSSLFPRPGKRSHGGAWFLNPNKKNTSITIMDMPRPPKHPSADTVETLLHELGHDINFESIVAHGNLPYLLRDTTSILTESFAMLIQEQAKTKEWFKHLGVDDGKVRAAVEATELYQYASNLIFLRWALVIYSFETQFYRDPSQDIGELWWKCKSKYQLLERPEGWVNPDALAKYHVPRLGPLMYSSYALGMVANVQFADLFAKKIGAEPHGLSYFGQKKLGDWLMKDFLSTGMRYRWDDFIKMYTGKSLSVKAWKRYFIDSDYEKKLFSTQ
jgi:peptidyl-dipeptidase A